MKQADVSDFMPFIGALEQGLDTPKTSGSRQSPFLAHLPLLEEHYLRFFSCPSLFSILKVSLQVVKTGWGDSTFHSGFHPVIPRLCVFIKECQVDSKQLSHAVVMFLRQSSKIWLDNYNRLSQCTSWVQHLPQSLIIDRPEVCLLGEKCARISVCVSETLLNGQTDKNSQ